MSQMFYFKSCIRKGTLRGSFVPTLCGSAFKNRVQPMLDAVIDFASLIRSPVKGVSMNGEEELQRKCSMKFFCTCF